MATIRLYDLNLSGYVEFPFAGPPEEAQVFIGSRSGVWSDAFSDDGAILLSEEWSADYFKKGRTPSEEVDPYPDFVLDANGVEVA